jgi:hypothetical protein
MCHGARLQSMYREVDVRAFAVDVAEILDAIEQDAVAVCGQLYRARVVRLRVIE